MSKQLAWRISFDSNCYSRNNHSISATIDALQEYDSDGNRDLSYGNSVYESDTEFHKIKVESYTSRDTLVNERLNPMYSMRYEWNDSDMGLAAMERAIKPMRKVGKYLENAYEVSGNPVTFGQYLLRVMKACKINSALIEVDSQWRLVTSDYACQLVDKQISEWQIEARKFSAVA